ncbi:MAG TPA: NAD(P)-binding domain-containing protein [Nocardioidaceae bacterium]|nr:NAD(P)-binding domain-containing protein [Nocardioidaceae bacterium]
MNGTERVDTVVIGAGQAGLAAGYHLSRRKQEYVILDRYARVGDVWRNRFESLRLYTPAKYDGLPGWPIPGTGWSWPTGTEMADYLEAYAARFELQVRSGVAVDRVAKRDGGFVVTSGCRHLEATNVVVATGGWQTPKTPDFAGELDPGIRQLHSNDYRNPSQLQPGAVLVVGLAHSGGDVALELSATHPTTVCGPVRGEIPFDIEGRAARMVVPLLWFAANHVLTQRNPLGRKMRAHVRGEGGPLLRVKRADLADAGVEHFEEKVVGVRDGKPMLEDGRVLDVRNVVWCTGFVKDDPWIELDVPTDGGWPVQDKGAVPKHPGLYFVGLPFQFAFASMLVGGVGRDAEFVAKAIAKRARQTQAAVSA